jgi:hypothetical protein
MRYRSPQAFRMALETRAVERARQRNVNAERVVLLFLMERFLERVFRELGDDAVTIKGGVALELRLERARTTRDLDLRAVADPRAMFQRLRTAGRLALDDFLGFDLVPTGDIKGEGVADKGQRFRVQASLGGKLFRHPFGLDVVFADQAMPAVERLPGLDTLGLIEAPQRLVAVYPLEVHLAEKVHAYTVQRLRPNSRVKDLIDMALLAERALPDADTLRAALHATFAVRTTHAVPGRLPPPPEHWPTLYAVLASSNGFAWPTIDAVFVDATRLLDPVLAGAPGTWDPATRSWISR